MYRRGIMNMIWRVRDRKMDFPAMPMDWKSWWPPPGSPLIQNAMVVDSQTADGAVYLFRSCMNILAMDSGISAPMALPSEVTATAEPTAHQRVLNRRLKRPEP